jgi:hypothetical protein
LSLWEVSMSTPGPSSFSNTTTLSPRVISFHSSRIKWRYSRAVSRGPTYKRRLDITEIIGNMASVNSVFQTRLLT